MFLAVGISHKTAPVELRERVALTEGRAVGFLHELADTNAIREAVALSTCNRTELYLTVGNAVSAEGNALSALAKQADLSPTELADHLYVLRGSEVTRHLFRVAAGLDSMIVGEAEIQGQVKRAYELALVEGTTGLMSNRLFRDAIAAGKRARSETGIGNVRSSVSSAAVDLAAELLGDLREQHVLVIGAGKTGELTAKALVDRGVETVYVANRRYDRAVGLAHRFGGEAIRLDNLPDELRRADIVVSGTASPHKIVDHEELALLMDKRPKQPLLVIDTAVPRDFDPAVRSIPEVHLYDIDDLQRLVERRASGRRAEALRAEAVIEEELDSFERWLSSLEVLPTVTDLRELADGLVHRVLRDNASKWESMSERDHERLEQMARSLVKRLLHEPTVRIKQAADEGLGPIYAQATRELFGLEASAKEEAERRAERPAKIKRMRLATRARRPE